MINDNYFAGRRGGGRPAAGGTRGACDTARWGGAPPSCRVAESSPPYGRGGREACPMTDLEHGQAQPPQRRSNQVVARVGRVAESGARRGG